MSTLGTISPILHLAYGEGPMVHDLAICLAAKIDGWPASFDGPNYGETTREHMVRMTCWDWMTGGSTAASVAAKIEVALAADEEGDTKA